ncbi:MAG: Signal peptidase [Chloroflexi bacterium]|nr:Signal peptidase [Chloroflexota bacterium]
MSEKLEQNQPVVPSNDGEPVTNAYYPQDNTVEDALTEVAPSTHLYQTGAADAGVTPDEALSPTRAVAADPETDVPLAPEPPVPPTPPTKSFWREVLETVLLTIMIFFLVKGLVANFRILGTSMEPSFHTDQLVLVNKAAYFHVDINSWAKLIPGVHPDGQQVVWLFGGPKRGDVLIFEPPDVINEDYIKRVIGLPGDKVEVKSGKVYVNDKQLDEPYIREAPFSPYNAAVVPPNHLFVMGDNRNASRDSRSFGMLPIDLIVGKALMVYWPTGPQWGPVPEVKYNF